MQWRAALSRHQTTTCHTTCHILVWIPSRLVPVQQTQISMSFATHPRGERQVRSLCSKLVRMGVPKAWIFHASSIIFTLTSLTLRMTVRPRPDCLKESQPFRPEQRHGKRSLSRRCSCRERNHGIAGRNPGHQCLSPARYRHRQRPVFVSMTSSSFRQLWEVAATRLSTRPPCAPARARQRR